MKEKKKKKRSAIHRDITQRKVPMVTEGPKLERDVNKQEFIKVVWVRRWRNSVEAELYHSMGI